MAGEEPLVALDAHQVGGEDRREVELVDRGLAHQLRAVGAVEQDVAPPHPVSFGVRRPETDVLEIAGVDPPLLDIAHAQHGDAVPGIAVRLHRQAVLSAANDVLEGDQAPAFRDLRRLQRLRRFPTGGCEVLRPARRPAVVGFSLAAGQQVLLTA